MKFFQKFSGTPEEKKLGRMLRNRDLLTVGGDDSGSGGRATIVPVIVGAVAVAAGVYFFATGN